MAYENSLTNITMESSADLSSYQYYAVKVNSSGLMALASSGDAIEGILQDEPAAANRQCVVGISGISKGVLGGSVTAGDDLEVDSSGTFVTQSSGSVVGVALESGSSGETIPILLKI